MAPSRPAVFVARDGILLDPGRGAGPELLTRQAGPFARELARLGFSMFAFAHEPGLARGELTPAGLAARERRLREVLERAGARLDGMLVCPHDPGAGREPCACLPPRPGLFLEAAARRRLDVTRSFLVGVDLDQIAAGRRAGLTTILVRLAAPADAKAPSESLRPHYAVADLASAVDLVRRARSASLSGDS